MSPYGWTESGSPVRLFGGVVNLGSRLTDIRKKISSLIAGTTLAGNRRLLYVLIAGAVALLVLVLALIVLLSASPEGSVESDATEPSGGGVPAETILVPPEAAFLPNERQRLLELEERRYREPRTPWDQEDLGAFWNPVRETAVDALTEQAAEEIDALFDSVE